MLSFCAKFIVCCLKIVTFYTNDAWYSLCANIVHSYIHMFLKLKKKAHSIFPATESMMNACMAVSDSVPPKRLKTTATYNT